MHYAWAGSTRNWYPEGESGPDGCTRRCARAAAIKRASIQLLAVGPSREGSVSRCSKDFSRLKNNSICQRRRYSPRTASAGSSAALRVVSIQITSLSRVRAATRENFSSPGPALPLLHAGAWEGKRKAIIIDG